MRLTSTLLAVLIAVGLWYWFIGRHDVAGDAAGDAAVAATAGDGARVSPQPGAATTGNTAGGGQAQTQAPATDRDAPVPVIVMHSVAEPTSARLILRGRTLANRNVVVAAETAGRVISEPLRRGSRVTKDQVLCKLEAGVRAAELAEAEARLAEAEIEAGATTRLQSKGYAAETTLRTREAQLGAARARLDRVRWDIARLEIRAPFDGVLETDTAEIGELLTPGAQCANVIDLSQIKVAGYVAEREVDMLTLGQTATARLINGVTATGTISFVSRMADDKTRTYAVEVTLPNADGRIRDGMTAELTIDLPPETAHFIPQSALTLDDAGRLGIRIDADGIARFLPVLLLRDEADGFWVSGLPDEVAVIVVGQEFVRDGRRVVGTTAGWNATQ